MAFLNKLNPTPGFPAYTGPYKVGSVDVEVPTSELEDPSASAPPCDIPTVAFRIFYPCRQDSEQKAVKWIPSPQREYISAYAKFLGANSAFASVFSLIPQLLYFISIPVHHNADILEPPTKSKQWPVMMFSHGLGGSRNAYSHICGSLASHGMVVVAPDHRDGSAPTSFYHSPNEKLKLKSVDYRRIDHKPSTDVYHARDEQLRIRLWELGLIHDALLKIDQRKRVSNVAEEHSKHGGKDMLTMFSNLLNVHEPGAITFAGHSFGACTTVQFVKSVYYRSGAQSSSYKPLFTPREDSSIVRQITPRSPVTLLDLWTLPIQSPDTAWLRSKPMPSYDAATGGSNLLAILSEGFYKWSSNFHETKRIVSRPSDSKSQHGPHIFYPVSSAHLSQSDFGVLFPWATAKVFGAKEPERVLRLNTRAILQVLRESGVEVGNTSLEDLEIDTAHAKEKGIQQDTTILSMQKDSVRGWINLSAGENGTGVAERSKREASPQVGAGPGEAMFQGEAMGQAVQDSTK
ncbi:hypothetical protein P153DRAFT_294017 [Dothidotthia symphoricarpi CBS 119687]|uniref:Putative phospholipase n=1 Tax=Dothidotthia symphoricarpi CBS 119687 TaxID=1392245 RepID=A0A6A6ABV2_9PLEO|nr:uncharacterized protein P153DRAFT_294017 [Dothidotthia symphoricarpi CBS 119687]KAF2128191.1 hypothetical protein P153DRAFT_294017 [Dothidotthia symphoricarpi CBS 119687]